MNNKINLLITACLFGLLFTGCKTWHTLEYETSNQPIQMGSHSSTVPLDTLGVISGYYRFHSEDAVYSEAENIAVTLGGDEYVEENITTTIYRSLDDNPDHFIADGVFRVEVEQGMTFWGFLRTVIAGAITGGESTGGEFSTQTIRHSGVVYKITPNTNRDENE
ncbi:hypothetical protein [Gracilimonas sp.]|uniref:hypothetical protein n=1 Tax=Gracilimonas sp. TaxID=1974203 RepID=UPI003D0E78A3